jgi:hypothetical protein
MNDYYGRLLTRIEISELRNDAEDAFLKLYNALFDQITMLEEQVRLLERKNRQLRGRLGE